MTRHSETEFQFVENVPEQLSEGVLYIAANYSVCVHLCFCGCGNEVSTPLDPTDWKLYFDGEAISLSPSIGSWSLPCRSHYFIRQNKVQWVGDWSDEQIRAARQSDQMLKARFYGSNPQSAAPEIKSTPSKGGFLNFLQGLFRKK